MKRFFLILLLLPSLGICSATRYHTHSFSDFIQRITTIHRHDNSDAIRGYHRTYNVRVPSYHRYYRPYNRPYNVPRESYDSHYHEHFNGNDYNNSHFHGHR
ncbi:Uncharacterised protein [Legionella beliardensis]|uniref:Uncharacterized protein n=1 Tax=Legionella beliardensis TaxID=91822 RepID=A0A378I3V6_9GAMM|nr:hypothetical protein [Legionella beliardensis]STX29542.1 Uncharacterised protein [Legionella beliardensis]